MSNSLIALDFPSADESVYMFELESEWALHAGLEKNITLADISLFIESNKNINEGIKQLRLTIKHVATGFAVGYIDLYELNVFEKAAYTGIIIYPEKNRRKGYAAHALLELEKFVQKHLKISTLFCRVEKINKASIRLFEKCGYTINSERGEAGIITMNKKIN